MRSIKRLWVPMGFDFKDGRKTMSNPKLRWRMSILLTIIIGWSLIAWSSPQTAPAGTVPVTALVSVEAKHGSQVPVINREDVRVMQGNNRLQVTDWVPFQGDQAGLELYVLLDDATDMDVATQFGDLRQFMNNQPATTAIAIGYMREGSVQIVQNLTKDHAQAGKALRIPLGSTGTSASPYLAVSDLIKHWPESSARREIFLISSGIDALAGGIVDPYLETTMQQAQRGGIQIYAIYASNAGHFGHTYWRVSTGQNNLSMLADATGGEFYYQGFQTPIAFKPFLDEYGDRLKHQYRLTFLAKPENKASYQHVKLETEVSNAELVTADKIFVPAAK
jgi:hypothetical protein